MSTVALGQMRAMVESAFTYAGGFEVTPLKLAEIWAATVLVPCTLAKPPVVMLTTEGLSEAHAAWVVRSCVVLSL